MDGTTGMALANVSMGVFAPNQETTGSGAGTEGANVGVVMTLAVARSGAVTADCSGQQMVSCQAARLMVSESTAPLDRGPANRRCYPAIRPAAAVMSQLLTGHRCITADSNDASGLGQVVRGGDAEAYAMDPIDMEASAQLASGGPDILLAAASGVRAQKIAAGQCSWMAGCAHPLGPAEVSLIFACWAFGKPFRAINSVFLAHIAMNPSGDEDVLRVTSPRKITPAGNASIPHKWLIPVCMPSICMSLMESQLNGLKGAC